MADGHSLWLQRFFRLDLTGRSSGDGSEVDVEVAGEVDCKRRLRESISETRGLFLPLSGLVGCSAQAFSGSEEQSLSP